MPRQTELTKTYIKTNCETTKTDCWEWQGSITKAGYGRVKHKGRTYRVHRLMGHFYLGLALNDKHIFVCHKCDNKKCCNPSHLFLGTNRDNQLDALHKGKISTGDFARNTKLSDKDVKFILSRYKKRDKQFNMVTLAKKFNVGTTQIARIIHGQSRTLGSVDAKIN